MTFTPMGVAHFCITCEDMRYNYRPIPTKHCNWHPSRTDKGPWHLIRGLAWSMSGDSVNQFVITSDRKSYELAISLILSLGVVPKVR